MGTKSEELEELERDVAQEEKEEKYDSDQQRARENFAIDLANCLMNELSRASGDDTLRKIIGEQLLIQAINELDLGLVQFLLKAGVDPNARDIEEMSENKGKTALAITVEALIEGEQQPDYNGDLEKDMLKALLEAGAKVFSDTTVAACPFVVALESNHLKLAHFLVQHSNEKIDTPTLTNVLRSFGAVRKSVDQLSEWFEDKKGKDKDSVVANKPVDADVTDEKV